MRRENYQSVVWGRGITAACLFITLLGPLVMYPQGSGTSSPTSKLPTKASGFRPRSGSASANRIFAAARSANTSYYAVNVEFTAPIARRLLFGDDRSSKIPGATVITVTDRFADLFLANDAAWDAIAKNTGVVRLEYLTTVTPPPPPMRTTSAGPARELPESIIRGGYKELTGKGVNIAILDTGLDFRHPDFSTLDASGQPVSRLKYLWDTSLPYIPGRGMPAPVKYPNGVSIGTVFTSAQLTAELRSSSQNIPAVDMDGHGTACASVAAGNGRGDQGPLGLNRNLVKGVAPEANLIGVRLGPAGSEFENSFLLNPILEWLDRVSGTEPLVVSGSFGGHGGSPHDGQSVQAREMDQRFPLTRAGRAMVFAAGNDMRSAVHKQVKVGADKVAVQWNATSDGVMDIYFGAEDAYKIFGTSQTPVEGQVNWDLDSLTGQYHATLYVSKGPGTVWLQNPAGTTVTADLYFPLATGDWNFTDPSPTNLVGSPGDTVNAITVGSYDWSDNYHGAGGLISIISADCETKMDIGGLSCYSSPGPNRQYGGKPGVVKPEIVAPGQWYESAAAKDGGKMVGWGTDVADSTGNYHLMNGTSAATPYTAGVVALIFQKRPALTLGALKDLLITNVSKQDLRPFAATPSGTWGYGKLDLAAIDRIMAKL